MTTRLAADFAAHWRIAAVVVCVVLSGCAGFHPQPHDEIGFELRILTKTERGVTISAVALGPEEARAAFGVPMIDRGIQPVWVRVENAREETLYLLNLTFDPLYFTPTEAAFINHIWLDSDSNARMDALFQEHALPGKIDGGATTEGFLYVTPDLGAKLLNFVYVGVGHTIAVRIVAQVPGLDKVPADISTLFDPDEIQDVNSEEELRAAIEALPCCVADRSGEIEADPLNFVLIGEPELGRAALIGGGWDATETVTTASAWKTTMSFLFGSAYRYSPVSDLYAFGRKQDAAFQIAREDIDERNHLRVWLAPLRFKGTPVWIGAISRDIGVIMSGFGTTHKIDPDVDSERWYLVQSLARAQLLKRYAFAKGGPVSRPENPRSSLEPKNIYYSDGLRVVMELSSELIALDEITYVLWETVDPLGSGRLRLHQQPQPQAGLPNQSRAVVF